MTSGSRVPFLRSQVSFSANPAKVARARKGRDFGFLDASMRRFGPNDSPRTILAFHRRLSAQLIVNALFRDANRFHVRSLGDIENGSETEPSTDSLELRELGYDKAIYIGNRSCQFVADVRAYVDKHAPALVDIQLSRTSCHRFARALLKDSGKESGFNFRLGGRLGLTNSQRLIRRCRRVEALWHVAAWSGAGKNDRASGKAQQTSCRRANREWSSPHVSCIAIEASLIGYRS